MADEGSEIEGVRILGAQEASEMARSGSSKRNSSRSRNSETVVTAPTEQTSQVELPHWSEAPTGEVPAALEDGEQGDGWEALTGSQPRIRVDQNDWKDVDYDPSLSLKDEALNVGALGEDRIDLNEDEDFDRELAQKRGSSENVSTPVTGEEKITKISTVPDSASLTPISSEVTNPSGKAQRIKAMTGKARRDKRSDVSGKDNSSVEENVAKEPQGEIATLVQRSITGAVLAALAIVAFILGPIWTLIFSASLIALMSLELCTALRKIGSKPAALLIAVMSFFSVVAGYLIGDRAIAACAVTFFVFTSFWYLFSIVKARPVIGLATSALVYLYVGVLGSFAGMIIGLERDGKSIGVFVLVSVVLCVAANDTSAYLVGKFIGRTPLAPAISPNKTLEGTTAGIVASMLVGLFVAFSSTDNIWGGFQGGIALGILVACAAIFGDLVESMLKRDCKLKDFGSMLPGHGGLLDRFDGLLFALPVAYFFALALI